MSEKRTSLRDVINQTVEHAFFAGAEWALMWHNGIGSPQVTRTVQELRRKRSVDPLPLIQQGARADIARAIMEAAISQANIEQPKLL